MKNLLNTQEMGGATMLRRTMIILLPILVLTSFIGCEENPSEVEDYDAQPVLTAFISNGRTVPPIRLEWVGTYGAYYEPELYGIDGADVKLFALPGDPALGTEDPVNTDTLTFYHLETIPGNYQPNDGDWKPEGKVRYRIEVTKPSDGIDLWAETTVPDTFSMQPYMSDEPFTPVEMDGDTLTRLDPEIMIRWTPSATAEGFVLGIKAETPENELMRLDPDWDPNDPDDELEEEDLNRYAYTVARYDQSMMTIPWLFVQWAGWNRFDIHAASKDYYEYVFSSFNGQSAMSSENFQFNVHGGLGIFGATARHSFRVYMERVE